ncbi:MAG: DUF2977 domain-containing protein [Balneola sp.]
MYIRVNDNHTIHSVSDKNKPDSIVYAGDLPQDFYQTFSKGKYLFIDDEIVLNPNWNEDNNEVLTLPEDVPHRVLLIEQGISSIEELQQIEDKTTIPGVGEVKASEINNYLNNEA